MRLFILAAFVVAVAPRLCLAEAICRELHAPDFGPVAQSLREPTFLITPDCQSGTLSSSTHDTPLALRFSAPVPFATTAPPTHLPPCPIIPLTVLFEFDRADLRVSQRSSLDKIPTGCRVRVAGHSCDLGPEAHNLDLSRRRAEAVATYLKTRGVRVVSLQGLGACCPTATERAANRRVVIDPAPGRLEEGVPGTLEEER